MKSKNTKKPLEENLRQNEKANTVFLKLLAKNRCKKNPFDEVGTYTSPVIKEIKPGPDYA